MNREPDRPRFTAAELRFLSRAAARLADGARRALLVGEALEPSCDDPPGLVLLDAAWAVESMTPAAHDWLDRMPDGDVAAGRLPAAVLAVAGAARAAADVRVRPARTRA
ncbi:MAG TPA: hypothetical protein VIW24_31775 [Aldersonia sp.]